MPVIRVLAGVAMILFAGGYYLIGLLFILGDASLGPYGPAFGVSGMLGICAPVILCGLHLAVSGKARSLRSRAVLVGALVLALGGAILAMLPYALATPPHPEAGNVVFGAIVMTGLFGWPMLAGLMQALLSKPD